MCETSLHDTAGFVVTTTPLPDNGGPAEHKEDCCQCIFLLNRSKHGKICPVSLHRIRCTVAGLRAVDSCEVISSCTVSQWATLLRECRSSGCSGAGYSTELAVE